MDLCSYLFVCLSIGTNLLCMSVLSVVYHFMYDTNVPDGETISIDTINAHNVEQSHESSRTK